MVSRQFYYPWVVIEFYHTMTSRREANPTALHFLSMAGQGYFGPPTSQLLSIYQCSSPTLPVIDSDPILRPGRWSRLLSMDATGGSILFKRHLPQRMLLINHILRSNMFPLHHIVQRRGAIFEVLYHISEEYWYSPTELIMTSLFHFEDRVHAGVCPTLSPCLFCFLYLYVWCLSTLGSRPSLDWSTITAVRPPLLLIDGGSGLEPSIFPFPGSDEDEPAGDSPRGDLSHIAEHTGEPPAPASLIPPLVSSAPASVPQAPMSSTPPKPSDLMPTARSDIAGQHLRTAPAVDYPLCQ